MGITNNNLQSEVTVAKNRIPLTTGKEEIFLEHLKIGISVTLYPNLYKLQQVALTIFISSATCELFLLYVELRHRCDQLWLMTDLMIFIL